MTPRKPVLLIFLFIITGVAGCTVHTPYTDSESWFETAVVETVIDGDTVRLDDGEIVRLSSIDAAEDGEPYAQEATRRLKELVEGKEVQLERGAEDRGRYGRLLRHIHVNETHVNLVLVKEGLATTYYLSDPYHYREELDEAERKAQQEERGLWNTSTYKDCITIPWFNWNAEGDDNKNLNDEYVIFQNTCEQLNMTGWLVKDAGTRSYTFPETILEEDQRITLYSGSGQDTDNSRYWGSTHRAVWNNQGDKLFLRDRNGQLVKYYEYNGFD